MHKNTFNLLFLMISESIVRWLRRETQNIEVRGFGTFKIRRRKTRMARNPRTGDPVEVAARPVPVFKPSKELRALVAGMDIEDMHDEDDDHDHDLIEA